MPFAATWMDIEVVILSEVSQTEKEKYQVISLICGILKVMIQVNLFAKQKQTHTLREGTYGYWGEGWGKGIVREFGIDMYTLLSFKWTYCIA